MTRGINEGSEPIVEEKKCCNTCINICTFLKSPDCLRVDLDEYVCEDYTPLLTIGKKYDNGKPRLAEMIKDFRESLIEVAKIWAFGADKYSKGNWRLVENGYERYSNAMLRHLVAEEDSLLDDESQLMHAAHVAWNALARLHFLLQANKGRK